MSSRGARLAWLPPLLVGAAAAVAAEVAIGILLYADEGLMRSLSTVLVTELAAFGVGLWAAPPVSPDLIDRIRKRWLACLAAFLIAAVFGTSWTVVREMGSGAWSQGLGLAILAALPLYTCGSVLGGLATAAAHDLRGPRPGPGASAAIGAAFGFAATGLWLPRSPIPSSLLVVCLVLISLGGMIYGVVLADRPDAQLREERTGGPATVRVEDRRGGRDGSGARVLLEGGQLRRRMGVGETSTDPWDVALGRALMPDPEHEWRVLAVGGGASAMPRALVREHPRARVDVLERTEAVVDLARRHLGTELEVGQGERTSVFVGNLDDLIESLDDRYDLVVVDGAALAPLGGSLGLSARSFQALLARGEPDGVLAWGPDTDGVGQRAEMSGALRLVREVEGAKEEILVTSPGSQELFRDGLGGFAVEDGGPSPP